MAEMPGAEYALWEAFMASEPIGHQREDINFALLKRQIAGLAGGKNLALSDFLPMYGEAEPVEDDAPNDPEFYRAAFDEMQQGK